MHATALLALTLIARPELVADHYPVLPPEHVCQALYDQACRDVDAIDRQLRLCDGWTRWQLQEARCDAERARQVWWQCWWLRWPLVNDWQRQDAESQLVDWVRVRGAVFGGVAAAAVAPLRR